MTGNAWTTYLAALRDLHAVRAAAVDRGENTEETLRARAERLEAFSTQLRQQEKTVVSLAYDLGKPVQFAPMDAIRPANALSWDEAVTDLGDRLDAAERAIDDTRHYGHLPPLLPTWPAFARNGAVYAVCSLPSIFINCAMWLFYVGSSATTGDQLTAAAWGCCFWPIASVVAGIVLIRMGSIPRLKPQPKNEFDTPKENEIDLNIPLGITISIGISAISIGLLWFTGTALNL